jgi:hypothetical protein
MKSPVKILLFSCLAFHTFNCTSTERAIRDKVDRLFSKEPEKAVANPYDSGDPDVQKLQAQYYSNMVHVAKKMYKEMSDARIVWMGFEKQDGDTLLCIKLKSINRYSSSTREKEQRLQEETEKVILPFLKRVRPMLREEAKSVKGVKVVSTYKYKNYLRQSDKLKEESAEYFSKTETSETPRP